ncbi:MAG: helix-turn-helix transcriptional regulator, partial [Oscillospiraceae bacterium]|nr:helix-turn-helix transcriptional regulator [Oscillospiraceae bacterium]
MLLMKLLTGLCSDRMQDRTVSDEVQTVKRFIENNYQRDLNMDDIAASVFRSNDYVQKQFKQVYGMTPYSYYMELKLECAKNLLLQTNLSVGQIAEKLGYKSDRYFSARFRRATGVTATQFRKQK